MTETRPARRARLLAAVLLALAVVLLAPGRSSAQPVASFTFAPTAPVVGSPVTFTFTGSCDAPPCRIQWRWFQTGGSSLGTTMGEGPEISYAFDSPGDYDVVVAITNALPTHGRATATQGVTVAAPAPPPVVVEDDAPEVRLDQWAGRSSATASNGGFRAGTGAAALSFRGRRVLYAAVTGPDLGVAQVVVDGTSRARLDLYSAEAGTRARVFRTRPGLHLLSVRSTGARNPASSGDAVSVDGFVTGPAGRPFRLDDRSPRITYGGWAGRRDAAASGGTVRTASGAGATVGLSFNGTRLVWLTATGPDQGRARIEVDGTPVAVFDNGDDHATAGVRRSVSGLAPGPHEALLVVLEPVGTGDRMVTVDAFEVSHPPAEQGQ